MFFSYQYVYFQICAVPEKNPYPPQGRSSEILRGRGVLKVKILEAMYEAKLKFPVGREGAKQKPSMEGGGGVFSGTAHSQEELIFYKNYANS